MSLPMSDARSVSRHADRAPAAQRGFTLLEVLIAIVIVSIGLLGVAAMQASTLKNAGGSKYRSAAITLSPAVVRQMLADSAAVAVRRAMRGDFKPFALTRPYQVEFALRRSYPAELIAPVDTLSGFRLEKTGDRTYRFVTSDAREMARLLDAIELVVLR